MRRAASEPRAFPGALLVAPCNHARWRGEQAWSEGANGAGLEVEWRRIGGGVKVEWRWSGGGVKAVALARSLEQPVLQAKRREGARAQGV